MDLSIERKLLLGLWPGYASKGGAESDDFALLALFLFSLERMTNQATSVSLLERIRLGPGDASWHDFVTLYNGLIEKWLLRQGVKRADAEDIRQEVMTVVLREIQSFEHNGRTGAFRNWLRTITANRLREFWRSRKRQRTVGEVDLEQLAGQLDDDRSEISRVWGQEHDRQMIEHLLLRVSRQFKPESMQAFREVVIEQRPIEQVSEESQLTINAIRIAQSRILRALREAAAGMVDI